MYIAVEKQKLDDKQDGDGLVKLDYSFEEPGGCWAIEKVLI